MNEYEMEALRRIAKASLVDDLAADIRLVDGGNSLGAGALAEALLERGWVKP